MRDAVLWRKQSHIIMLLADKLNIGAERALDLFYSTETYRRLANPDSGIRIMSDLYILEDILKELESNNRN